MDIDPRVLAMRERHGREQSTQLDDFMASHPDFSGDVGYDNWAPAEEAAWRQYTAAVDARQQAERHQLAVEMGYYSK